MTATDRVEFSESVHIILNQPTAPSTTVSWRIHTVSPRDQD